MKLLGTPQQLQNTLDKFKSKVPLIKSRTVDFTTDYFYKQNVELKELSGGKEDGISKRIEITERNGGSFTSLYFNLLARPDYPNQALKPSPLFLERIFQTSVVRDEEEFELTLPNGRVIQIESAFDQIKYIDKDGIMVGSDNELEFEIHNLKDIDDMKAFVDWFDKVIYSECECEKFFGSKAQRARRFISLHSTPAMV